MRPQDELVAIYGQKLEEEETLAAGNTCQQFRSSAMYALLDRMMAALVDDAMEKLQQYRGSDRDEVFQLNLRWQERKQFRQAIVDEIDGAIEEAARLMAESTIDPGAWKARHDIERGH